MTPDLLTEAPFLTPTETTQPLKGDYYQSHGRIQECGDSLLSSFGQSVVEQGPPRALPRRLEPLDESPVHQFVKVLPQCIVGEPHLGEYLLKGPGFSVPQNGHDTNIVEVHFIN